MKDLQKQVRYLDRAFKKVVELTGAYYIGMKDSNTLELMLSPEEFAKLPGASEIEIMPYDSKDFPFQKMLRIEHVQFQCLMATDQDKSKDGEK